MRRGIAPFSDLPECPLTFDLLDCIHASGAAHKMNVGEATPGSRKRKLSDLLLPSSVSSGPPPESPSSSGGAVPHLDSRGSIQSRL